MKVHLKNGCGSVFGNGPFELVEESHNYFLCRKPYPNDGDFLALDKQYFELIKEPPPDRWRDVTGECEIERYQGESGNISLWHRLGEDHRMNVLARINDNGDGIIYHLRKVRVIVLGEEVLASGADTVTVQHIRSNPQWAFLVERKEPS